MPDVVKRLDAELRAIAAPRSLRAAREVRRCAS